MWPAHKVGKLEMVYIYKRKLELTGLIILHVMSTKIMKPFRVSWLFYMGVKICISHKDTPQNENACQQVPRRTSGSDIHGITSAPIKLHNDDLKHLYFSQSSFRIIAKSG
jgi:hypothetical protein